MNMLNRYAFSTFVHGCAHLSLAYRDYAADPSDGTPVGKDI